MPSINSRSLRLPKQDCPFLLGQNSHVSAALQLCKHTLHEVRMLQTPGAKQDLPYDCSRVLFKI